MNLNTEERQALKSAIANRRDWAIETLRQLVSYASTLGHEREAQQYLAGVLKTLGLTVKEEEVDRDSIAPLPGYSPALMAYSGRPNVVAFHTPSQTTGKSLVFNGHIDVVSAAPDALWETAPFDTRVESDDSGETWMYGRGAGDMKGGTICALWAYAALHDLGWEPAAPIVFQSPIEEECTGNGTLALCHNGYLGDACIIPEPFGETMLYQQAGVLWFDLRVMGKTTHVLGAQKGVNAIDKAYALYGLLKEKVEAVVNRVESLPPAYKEIPHPINLNLGVIKGGDWPSTVAGECVLRMRMGLLPGMNCDQMAKRIQTVIDDAVQGDLWLQGNPPEIVFRGFKAEPCTFDADGIFAATLSQCHRAVHNAPPTPLHATCTTDARFFNLYYNVPATCYGPVAENIHGADERVSVDSMERVSGVMADFIANWCLINKG